MLTPKDPIMLSSDQDRLFRGSHYPKPFEFNKEVAGVFDDMVQRSIPLYREVAHLAGQWALAFYQKGSRIYDIGCSTGTVISYIGEGISSSADFVGIDLSAPMIERAKEKLAHFPSQHRLKLICGDVMEQEFDNASVIIVNYTLQFLPVKSRALLIQRIFDGLRPGGILFMSEKVKCQNPEFQETSTVLYEEFKLRQGYTKSEIARKKEALENVLIPLTEADYHKAMASAGFTSQETIGKWYNFCSFVAQKPRGS